MTANLDPVLHSPARISIMFLLLRFDRLQFGRLRKLAGLTSGNLATHLGSLERAGYIVQSEAIVGLRPGTLVASTERGRAAFRSYIADLERLVAHLRTVTPASPGT